MYYSNLVRARSIVQENLGGAVDEGWFGEKEYEDGDPLNQEDYKKWSF